MATLAVDIGREIMPAFYPVVTCKKPYVWVYGGSGSGKTWTMAQLVILCCTILPTAIRFLIVRKVARTLRQSVFRRICAQLTAWGMYRMCRVNKTDMVITFPNGSEALFCGLDDEEKLKGIDEVDKVWVEEATELTEREYDVGIDRGLRGSRPVIQQIFATFNPINRLHWLKKRMESLVASDTSFVHHSTYRDNPFVGEQYASKMAALKSRNAQLGAVYADGMWGSLEGLIFRPLIMDPWQSPMYPTHLIYGMDFGYTDQTALTEIQVYEKDAYVREMIYASEMTDDDRVAEMDRLGISRTAPIYGDPASPASIEAIARAGYNIFPADKGPGSVRSSIEATQEFKIHSLPDNVNLNSEWETYVWAQDKTGMKIDGEPVDFHNHAIDAVRMALFTHFRERTDSETIIVNDWEQEYGQYAVPDIMERYAHR